MGAQRNIELELATMRVCSWTLKINSLATESEKMFGIAERLSDRKALETSKNSPCSIVEKTYQRGCQRQTRGCGPVSPRVRSEIVDQEQLAVDHFSVQRGQEASSCRSRSAQDRDQQS